METFRSDWVFSYPDGLPTPERAQRALQMARDKAEALRVALQAAFPFARIRTVVSRVKVQGETHTISWLVAVSSPATDQDKLQRRCDEVVDRVEAADQLKSILRGEHFRDVDDGH